MQGCLSLSVRYIHRLQIYTSVRRHAAIATIFRQGFHGSPFRAAQNSIPVSPLERRISDIPLERYRNFCIVAHVDHGKSTLSDRLLELTGTISPGGNKQILDKLDVERERGITVKAQTCSMIYNYKGHDYLLHLVDTPGHVDFRAEVSRSYASCGGAVILVDASQGVQAQTVANFYLAFSQGLELVPVVNKVDLQSANVSMALEQMQTNLELDPEKAILVSAKTGLNVEAILPRVIENVPA
ncbi:MAG: Translation factor guf1 mitochondrial [Peltula sp. TS41687]|nr:MAG: Translation factor guf1 mitochondrial [Peltula sp. TS41687]